MALVSGAADLMPRLLHLINRTIHELALLIRHSTPFLLAIVDMINKAIGGLYLLFAMLWRDSQKTGLINNVHPFQLYNL